MKRGDIVIVDFSLTNPGAGIRPAVVIQNDRDNGRIQNTIVAQVTSNIRRAHEDTQILIDQNSQGLAEVGIASPFRHQRLEPCHDPSSGYLPCDWFAVDDNNAAH